MRLPKVSYSDWDSPRRPEPQLHVAQGGINDSFNRLGIDAHSYREFHKRLPGRVAEFLDTILTKRLVWGLYVCDMPVDGFAMRIRLEMDHTCADSPPFDKYIRPIVELAESSDWAGPAQADEIAAYSLATDSSHDNHPPTEELLHICRRFGVAMEKLAAM